MNIFIIYFFILCIGTVKNLRNIFIYIGPIIWEGGKLYHDSYAK